MQIFAEQFRLIEVAAMLHDLRAERAHGGDLVRVVLRGNDENAANAEQPSGVGERLAMIAGRATDVRHTPACRFDAIRRPRSTPIWKLEAALKCRSCHTPGY